MERERALSSPSSPPPSSPPSSPLQHRAAREGGARAVGRERRDHQRAAEQGDLRARGRGHDAGDRAREPGRDPAGDERAPQPGGARRRRRSSPSRTSRRTRHGTSAAAPSSRSSAPPTARSRIGPPGPEHGATLIAKSAAMIFCTFAASTGASVDDADPRFCSSAVGVKLCDPTNTSCRRPRRSSSGCKGWSRTEAAPRGLAASRSTPLCAGVSELPPRNHDAHRRRCPCEQGRSRR